MSNHAFIDAQNLHKGVTLLGWKLDWNKFRVYLREKYKASKAYLFIGYISEHQEMYNDLQKCGYILIFKPVIFDRNGNAKGNCNADLVLQAILEKDNYDKAVVVTSDGDFYSLIRYLYISGKLEAVISPHVSRCSKLLKKEAKEKIVYMDKLKGKLGK